MEEYSEIGFLEGDSPIDYVDLPVFVAPPLAKGASLFERKTRDRAREHLAAIDLLAKVLESPEGLVRLLSTDLGSPLGSLLRASPELFEGSRRSIKAKISDLRRAPPPDPTEHWVLRAGYEGIVTAGLIIVNRRKGFENSGSENLLADITRLRKDESIFADIVKHRGNRVPVTAVVADLSDADDPGVRKATARVKRVTRRF